MVAKEFGREVISMGKVKTDGEALIAAGDEEEDDVVLPGFRFHPTDEELVTFYLRRKVARKPLSIEIIKEMDIYKHDPWDLPSKCAHVLLISPGRFLSSLLMLSCMSKLIFFICDVEFRLIAIDETS